MKFRLSSIAIFIVIVLLASPVSVSHALNRLLSIEGITNLSGTMVAGGEVNSFEISPDGNYAVFRADKDLDGTLELYSVNLQTHAVVKLNDALSDGYDVSNIAISPNSQWVVYSVLTPSSGRYLKSVLIGGGTTKYISHPLLPVGRYVRGFQITPDSANVIFTLDYETEDFYELYKSPMTGVHLGTPPVLPEKLNSGLPADHYVSNFQVSPNGSFIIYRAQNGGYGRSLWHVLIGGGTNTKISTDVTNFYMNDFYVSPNNQRVIYIMQNGSNTAHRMYSVLSGGGTATRLDAPTLSESLFDQVRITNNSAYVVFTGKLDDANKLEIYSVPLAGPSSSMEKLNGTLVSGGNIDCGMDNSYYDFAISPDSSTVVYCADYFVDNRYEIFRTLTAGNSVITRLSQVPSVGNGAYYFKISPDGTRVIYNGRFTDAIYLQAYSMPLSGGTPTPLAEFALGNLRGIPSFIVAPDSSHTVLSIGTNSSGTEGYRLYQTGLEGGVALNLTPNPTNTGQVDFLNQTFTPDSKHVVVISDMDNDDIDELFLLDTNLSAVFLPLTIKP